MREIDAMTQGRTETVEKMGDMMNDSITQIKVLALRLRLIFIFKLNIIQITHPALDDHIDNGKRLSGILDTIIGTTSTILSIFKEASSLIPVPFVKPLVASVASLLTAVQVSLRLCVVLSINNC